MPTKNFEGLTCFTEELEVASFNLKETDIQILESDYLPGYYSKGDFPLKKENYQKHHFYLPVKKSVICFQDVVLKIAARIKKEFKAEMHVSPGQMTFQNKNYQCVKIRANETKQMKLLVSELQNAGINFFPPHKVEPYKSVIYTKRYVSFTEIFEGIYRDQDCEGRYFIQLQETPEYPLFKEIISKIKYNCKFHLFDSFLSSHINKNKVIDFAGIYSEHCQKERLNELKAELEKELLKVH